MKKQSLLDEIESEQHFFLGKLINTKLVEVLLVDDQKFSVLHTNDSSRSFTLLHQRNLPERVTLAHKVDHALSLLVECHVLVLVYRDADTSREDEVKGDAQVSLPDDDPTPTECLVSLRQKK